MKFKNNTISLKIVSKNVSKKGDRGWRQGWYSFVILRQNIQRILKIVSPNRRLCRRSFWETRKLLSMLSLRSYPISLELDIKEFSCHMTGCEEYKTTMYSLLITSVEHGANKANFNNGQILFYSVQLYTSLKECFRFLAFCYVCLLKSIVLFHWTWMVEKKHLRSQLNYCWASRSHIIVTNDPIAHMLKSKALTFILKEIR